jgi:hypothetical protein
MKKLLSIVLMSSLATTGFASTLDSRTVIVENNEKQDSFALNTVTTRTEYRTEVVQSTCYRQEVVGYRRVCYPSLTLNAIIGLSPKDVGPHPAPGPHPRDPRDPPPERKPEPRPEPRPNPRPEPRPEPRPNPRPEPRPEPRPNPRPEPRPNPYPNPRPEPRPNPYPDPRPVPRPEPRPPVCYDEPIYREVAYSCMKTISVPYEVVDHESTANVQIKLSAAPQSKPQTGNCGINFALQGDNFQASNSCREYLAVGIVGRQQNGSVTNYSYFINLFDAERIFAPLAGGLTDLHVEGSTLLVRTGDIRANQNFALKLYVERKRFLKSDVVLINRVLKAEEFSYQPGDARTGFVRIDLDKVLGGFEEGKKHNIKVDLDLALPAGSVINGSPIPQLHQEASTTVF